MKRVSVWYTVGSNPTIQRFILSGSIVMVLREFKKQFPLGRVIKVEEQYTTKQG